MGNAQYDPSTNRGKVRLLLGDTGITDPIFDDDEIDAFLTMESNVRLAAAQASLAIANSAAKSAIAYRVLSQSLDIDKRNVPEAYRENAKQLRQQVRSGPAEEIDSLDHAYGGWGGRIGEFVGEQVL